MRLSKNWFIEKNSDFEYLKYSVLAYLQEVKNDYNKNIIQPHLDNLSELYNDSLVCVKNMEFVNELNTNIIGLNVLQKVLYKEDTLPKSELFENIRKILSYATPKFDKYITKGRSLENELSSFIKLENLPVSPVNRNSGMLFVKEGDNVKVYNYERLCGNLEVEFIETVRTGIGNSVNNIKSLYQENNNNIVCVYVVSSEVMMPAETMVYLTTRKLSNFLSNEQTDKP